MKKQNHRQLGEYLAQEWMEALSPLQRTAFLFGCIEPDLNMATYLKGSLHSERLRGHNFGNASRCMSRIVLHLQRRRLWGPLAYYRLGKLIHYTCDAFTYPHNKTFHDGLLEHRSYEAQLRHFFPQYLSGSLELSLQNLSSSVMQEIEKQHQRYLLTPMGLETDSHFAVLTATRIFSVFSVFSENTMALSPRLSAEGAL